MIIKFCAFFSKLYIPIVYISRSCQYSRRFLNINFCYDFVKILGNITIFPAVLPNHNKNLLIKNSKGPKMDGFSSKFWCGGYRKAWCLSRTTSQKLPKIRHFRHLQYRQLRLFKLLKDTQFL